MILTHQALAAWQGVDLNTLMDHDSSGSSEYDRVGCLDGHEVEGFRVGPGWGVGLGSLVSQSAMWLPSEDPRLFYAVGLEWAENTQPDHLLAVAESVDEWKPLIGPIDVGPEGLLLAHAASTMTEVAELSAFIPDDSAQSDVAAEIGSGLRFRPPVGDYLVDGRYVRTDAGESFMLIRFKASLTPDRPDDGPS